MRAFLLAALAATSALAAAQEHTFALFQEDKKVGTMTHRTDGNDADGYVNLAVVTLDEGPVKITDTTKYDAEGVVTESSLAVDTQGVQFAMTATYDDAGANVKVKGPDGSEEGRTVPKRTETTRKDETWFWFKKVKPEVGRTTTYQEFDLQTGEWSDVTHTYTGPGKTSLDGKELDALLVDRVEKGADDKEEKSVVALDAQGDLLKLETEKTRIERVG